MGAQREPVARGEGSPVLEGLRDPQGVHHEPLGAFVVGGFASRALDRRLAGSSAGVGRGGVGFPSESVARVPLPRPRRARSTPRPGDRPRDRSSRPCTAMPRAPTRARCGSAPYRGLFPSPPLFDRMPTYRTQGKRSLNFLSAIMLSPDAQNPSGLLSDPINTGPLYVSAWYGCNTGVGVLVLSSQSCCER